MKKNQSKKAVAAKGSAVTAPAHLTSAERKAYATLAPEVTSAPATAQVVEIPAPAPEVTSAPVIATPVINQDGTTTYTLGIPNITRRVTPGTPLTSYRVVPNQRKNVNCRYYVQGGVGLAHPNNPGRIMFAVAVEIPYQDLRSAQLRCNELNAQLRADKTAATA